MKFYAGNDRNELIAEIETGTDAFTGKVFLKITQRFKETTISMTDEIADQLAHNILDAIANNLKGKTHAPRNPQ